MQGRFSWVMHVWHEIRDELRQIAQEILAEGKTEQEWAEVEACDWFQVDPYLGGFEGGEFTFSYFADDGSEWWLAFPLQQAEAVASGELSHLGARPAE